MSATVLYMSMSLDGFIAGPNVRIDNGLGDGGERLHEWALEDAGGGHKQVSHLAGADAMVFDEMMSTGAVVAGRGTFEPAGGWGGDHHDGVPIFLLTRRGPLTEADRHPSVTCVGDVAEAMAAAREAAGERDVLVHGAGVARLALAAGVLDEIEIHLVPVLLGQGRRLFEGLPAEHAELERVRVLEGAEATHLRFRVRR